MAARTSKSKKVVAEGVSDRFLFDKIEYVPVTELKPHPKNPRLGNVDAVAESLTSNGQYKPIVVNKKTGFIAAGHHTWLAARKLGWETIGVVYIAVDEAAHLRIMLADNKTADLGTYDETLLAEILAGIATDGGLVGTGYNEADFQDLIQSVQTTLDETDDEDTRANLKDLMSTMPKLGGKTLSKREQYQEDHEDDEEHQEAQKSRGVVKAAKPEEDDAEEIDNIEDVEAELQAVLEVKVENFDFWKQSSDAYQIPELRDDFLLEEIPEPLKTWGGHEATPDDGRSWFLYNYSLGGIKGLPFDRSILSFFTYDEKFEGWWETPAWYTCRVLAKGCRNAIVPDFSFYYSTPRIVHLHNVYRAQWLGRFFQEAGMRVAPRLQFDYTDPNTLEIALRGIPQGCPVLATSQQNPEKKEDEKRIAKYLQEAIDTIKPESIIFYSGPPGKRAMESVRYEGKVVYLPNYVSVRRDVAFGKGTNRGLGKGTAKDRAKALQKARKRLEQPEDDD